MGAEKNFNRRVALMLLALVTGFMFSFFILNPVFAQYLDTRQLKSNCASFTLGNGRLIEDTTFDPEKHILIVDILDKGKRERVILPTRDNPVFPDAKCSTRAIRILDHTQEVYDRMNSGLCKSFREIINGTRPLKPRGGKMPRIEGAVNYVKKHCK